MGRSSAMIDKVLGTSNEPQLQYTSVLEELFEHPSRIVDPQDLPKFFYRVHYDESSTLYAEDEGYSSKIRFAMPKDFDATAVDHLNRSRDGESRPSPFISVFSDEAEALRWAKQLQKDRTLGSSQPGPKFSNLRVDRIYPKTLHQASFIFKVEDLVCYLPNDKVKMIKESPTNLEHEFLCLWRVPKKAIKDQIIWHPSGGPLIEPERFSERPRINVFDTPKLAWKRYKTAIQTTTMRKPGRLELPRNLTKKRGLKPSDLEAAPRYILERT